MTYQSSVQVSCLNPALAAGDYNLVVRSGDHTYNTEIKYADTSNPEVVSVTPNEGKAEESITIEGSNFGNDEDEVSVSVGGANCDITAFTSSQISCTLGAGVAGDTTVDVSILYSSILAEFPCSKLSLLIAKLKSNN